METAGQIALHVVSAIELAIMLALLLLRRSDEQRLRRRLRRVDANQGKLAQIVRSSLHPPPSRCGECDHEHEHHFGPLGQQRACGWKGCACVVWSDPLALDFEDEATPTDREPAR